jgi:hypothetical protein
MSDKGRKQFDKMTDSEIGHVKRTVKKKPKEVRCGKRD